MAEQKVYKIVIEGVDVAIKDINTLKDAIDGIGDKTSSKQTDELAAAQRRLAQALSESAEEVASVKAQAKEAMNIAKLQAQVNDNVEGSYNRLSAQYALNKIELNKMSDEERRTTEEGKKLVQETNEIYQKMKELQAETGKMSLNVGNYTDSVNKAEVNTQSLKEELKSIKDEMANMVLNGQKGSEEFQQLAQRAGELKDAMADANDEISHFASDTRGIDNVINLASTATAAFGVYQGVMATLNIEDEEFEQTMQKMAGVMTTLNSLQQLQNNLLADGSATAKVYHTVMKAIGLETSATAASTKALTTATEANTVATNAATVATHGLGVALKMIGIGLIIAAVAALIEYWDELVGWFEETIPELKEMEKYFNKLKQVFFGVGNAVLKFLIAPLRTFAAVMADIINGDFDKILEDSTKYLKEGLDFVNNYLEGAEKEIEKQQKDGLKRQNEQLIKALDDQYKDEVAKNGKSHKLTQEYLKKKMALVEKDSEEYKELQRQLWADIRQEQDEHDREMKAKHDKALQDRMAAEEKAAKEYQQLLKNIERATSESWEKMNDSFNDGLNRLVDRFKDIVNRPPEEVIKVYKNAGDAIISQIDTNSSKVLTELTNKYLKLLKDAGAGIDEYVDKFSKIEENVNEKIADAQDDALGELSEIYVEIVDKIKEITERFNLGEITKKQMDEMIRETYIGLESSFSKVIKTYNEKMEGLFGNTEEQTNDVWTEMLMNLDIADKNIDKIFDAWTNEFEALERKHWFEINKATEENLEQQTEALKEAKDKQLDIEKEYIDKLLNETKTFVEGSAESLSYVTDFLGNKMNEIFKPKEFKAKLSEYREQWGYSLTLLEDRFKIFKKQWDGELEAIIYTYGEDSEEYRKAIEWKEKLNAGYLEDVKNGYKEALEWEKKLNDGYLLTVELVYGLESEEYKEALEWREKLNDGYLEDVKNGYKEAIEWKEKLNAGYLEDIKAVYGQDSDEYKKALKEREEEYVQFLALIKNARKNANVDNPLELSTTGSTTDTQKVQKKNPIQKAMESWEEAPYETIADIYDEINDLVLYPAEDAFNAYLDFVITEAEQALEEVQKLHDEAIDKVEESSDRIAELQDKMKDGNQEEVESMKQALADEQLLLAQRTANEERLAREEEQKERELRHREKQQQRLDLGRSLIEASVNTAMGVTKALGDYGWPLGPIFAGFIAAMGAVQTAFIAKQLTKLEDGGLLKGKSHSQGGIPVGDTGIEVEGGEVVINKKSSKKFLPFLDAINAEGNGGKHTVMPGNTTRIDNYISNNSNTFNRTYSNGGVFTTNNKSVTNYIYKTYKTERFETGGVINYNKVDSILHSNNANSDILKAMRDIDFSPVVSVVDINRGQKNLTRVQMLAGKK